MSDLTTRSAAASRTAPRLLGPRTLRGTMGLIVSFLAGLLVVSAVATGAVRLTVGSAEQELTERILPARQAVSDLGAAYLDELTAERQIRSLTGLLGDDPADHRALEAVTTAASTWRTAVAEPGIAARASGPIPADRQEALVLEGTARFDQLRSRLAALEERTAAAITAQVARIGDARATANGVTIGALVLAGLVAALGALVFRRRFSRPLDRLVGQVQAVADGAYDAHITPVGARELAVIADSVDRMRGSIVTHSRELVAAQRDLTLREEHDRLATDLHDLTIQRVFALGLGLTSISRRQPETAPALAPLIVETDRIIGEVRAVIFDLGPTDAPDGLHGRVLDLAEQSVRALGFAPTVRFSGPVDDVVPDEIGREIVAVLREALSNVAQHAGASAVTIEVSAADAALTLTVADDGKGLGPDGARGDGVASMQARAARLGGHAAVRPGESAGAVAEWRVPLRPAQLPDRRSKVG